MISVAEGATVVLACPGPSNKNTKRSANTVNHGNAPEVSLQCSSKAGGLVDQQLATVELSQLGCSANPSDTEQVVVGARCGPPNQEGQLVDIGFYVGDGQFRSVISVCHVTETEQTLYARHTIHGNYTRDRIRESASRPAFREGGIFYRQVRAAQAYSRQSQQEMFTRLFGPQLAGEYFSNSNYLAKGHLAPDADFYFKGKMHIQILSSNLVQEGSSVSKQRFYGTH